MNVEPSDTIVHAASETAGTRPIACIECSRQWVVASERWRLKVTDWEPIETVPYCADCATREFG